MTDLNTPDRSDAEWFRRSLVQLGRCPKATYTTLRRSRRWKSRGQLTMIGALHCLHMHSMRAGGVPETRDVLGRMAKHVRELGLHRDPAVVKHPEEDKLEKMLFGTLYKDRSVPILRSLRPFTDILELVRHDL